MAIVVILGLELAITLFGLFQGPHTTPLGPVYSLVPSAIQNFPTTVVTISFLFLLHNLRERYATLNEYLRYSIQILLYYDTFVYELSKSNDRRQFIKNNTFGATSKTNRQYFKFIGRQYGCLADIMNHLNCCYSFQVLHFDAHLIYICASDDNYPVDLTLISDDVQNWFLFYLLYHLLLLALSSYSQRRQNIRIYFIPERALASSLFSGHIDGYLSGSSSYK